MNEVARYVREVVANSDADMNGLTFDFADDSTGEPWDVFGPLELPSPAKAWLAFGLKIGGCAIAGLGLGYLVGAVILDRILHRTR